MLMRAAMGAVKYVMVFQRPAKVKHHWAMGPVCYEHGRPWRSIRWVSKWQGVIGVKSQKVMTPYDSLAQGALRES